MADVNSEIVDVQAAFLNVEKPQKLLTCQADWCTACLDQTHCDTLLSIVSDDSLIVADQNAKDLIEAYILEAILTVGTVDDFKYVAPKLLVLHAQGSDVLSEPHVFCEKLALAGFNQWSEVQQSSVGSLIYNIFNRDLKAQSADVDEWLSGACQVGLPTQGFIDLLERDYAQVSRRNFIDSCYIKSIQKQRMAGVYWDSVAAEKTQLVHDWLVSQPVA